MSIGGKSLHKEDYLKLAILAAGTATGFGMAGMGPMAGMFATGAGAASAGAGGVAAGEMLAGGGIAGMGAPMASMFGPSAAGAGLLNSMAPAAATPWITEGAALGGGALGGELAALGAPLASPNVGILAGTNFGKGFETMQKIQKLQELAGGGQKEKPEPVQRPPVQPVPISDAVRYWQQIYGGLA